MLRIVTMNVKNSNSVNLPDPISSFDKYQSNEGHLGKEKKDRMNNYEPMQNNSDDNVYRIVLTKSKIIYESRPPCDKILIKAQDSNQDINEIDDSLNSNFEGQEEEKCERFPDVVSYYKYFLKHPFFCIVMYFVSFCHQEVRFYEKFMY